MLKVSDLTRSGLEPADLSVEGGQCAVVRGKSGSGKSLLLRAIADLDPNTGSVSLDGRDRDSMPAPDWRRQVTHVAAESGWWRDRVGDHFPDPAGTIGGLVRLGFPSDAFDWPISRLSTGEKQRLSQLRAMSAAPKVLLLDEPTSALDAEAAARVESILHEKLEDGVAIVLVTHDKAQAQRMSDVRFLMRSGRLEPDDDA